MGNHTLFPLKHEYTNGNQTKNDWAAGRSSSASILFFSPNWHDFKIFRARGGCQEQIPTARRSTLKRVRGNQFDTGFTAFSATNSKNSLTLLRRTGGLWHVTWDSRLRDLWRGLLRMPPLLGCLWLLLLLWELGLRLGHLWLWLNLSWGGCRGRQVTGCSSCTQLSSLELFLMELLSFSKELLTLVLKLTTKKIIKQVTRLPHSDLVHTTGEIWKQRFHSENVSNDFRPHLTEKKNWNRFRKN